MLLLKVENGLFIKSLVCVFFEYYLKRKGLRKNLFFLQKCNMNMFLDLISKNLEGKQMKINIAKDEENNLARRNSAVEVLRIVAMVFIVCSHYSFHGMIAVENMQFGLNQFILQSFVLGNLGVNLFVLITGYYNYQAQFDIKRLLKIWLQTIFYSIILFLVFSTFQNLTIDKFDYLRVLFPIIFKEYWFVSAYFVLYIISPFINAFLNALDRNKYKKFIIIAVILWYLIPTLFFGSIFGSDMFGNELCQFLVLYSIGQYMRKYHDNIIYDRKNSWNILILSWGLLILSTLSIDLLSLKFPSLVYQANYFYSRSSILILCIAISLFAIASSAKVFYNKYINKISSCTLGVYLIHETPCVREWLWSKLLNNSIYANSINLITHMIFSVFIVFTVCSFIEYGRKKVCRTTDL